MKITLLQKIQLRLHGYAYTEHRIRPGWTAPIAFYAFKCPTHGLVEDYPHGHAERFICPKCTR